MPLLDIATSRPCSCFQNNILASRSKPHFRNKLVVNNGKGLGFASAFSWKTCCVTDKLGKNLNLGRAEVWRGGLMIKAVATLDIASVAQKNQGVKGYQNMLRMDIDSSRSNSTPFETQSSSEDSTKVEDRERLRRMRISTANSGKTPWNKGRKHSPETVQRIKERTRLAMQDPKVRMKLVNLGHAQSEETRIKIGVGVRLGWGRRREKLMVQEACHYLWQNLIAEAARTGLSGEEKLQWDSYKTLNKQLEQEWLQTVEERKTMPKTTGSKRAPKSAEQKRKIAESISAKWNDPEYRDRVCSGLAKFHGISERVERKPRREPSGDGQTRKRNPTNGDETDNLAKHETKGQIRRIRLKKRNLPSYKDPFASSKLEMLKNIRARRAATIDQKSEAISRAKLLIAEAEKAAEALEIAAKNSPDVHTSLLESRMLIAEAIQFMKSIENEDPISFQNDACLSKNSIEPVLVHAEEEIQSNSRALEVVNHNQVNGVHSLSATDIKAEDFSLDFLSPNFLNGNASDSYYTDPQETEQKYPQTSSSSVSPESNGEKPLSEFQSENTEAANKQVKVIKKWVSGRLVEVVEEI